VTLFADFVELLVVKCTEDESTAFVDSIYADALEAIAGGKGVVSSLTSSGVNGKTFSRAVNLTPIEVARACQTAVAIFADEETEIGSTYGDFSSIQR
jgi:hypothetical protein